ncbi:hypothetical protein SCLCIDRAFT_1207018 [Scleroderma citrinum Foug A]|uniref:Uncharacterized protein n=1 Tax=Scleroderma citrinum Foug A TaxID=1036808 RepID=A0A0C3EDU0_9AGAM|nr:hypothetical protein SCLCIDRAFT_1207018 [Scleroderma citrinum Foug A]
MSFHVSGSFGCYRARAHVQHARVVPGPVCFICTAICIYAVSTSYPALGMSMYMLDLSAWFPQPFSLSRRPLAALSGGVSVSFAMLCMPVCTFDVSEWFPQLFGSSEVSRRGSTWLVRSAGGSIAMGLWSRDGCGCA